MAGYDFMSQPLMPSVNQWGNDTFSDLALISGNGPQNQGQNPSFGAPAIQPRNMFSYTPWGSGQGQARGLGYFGANMPLFSAGIQGLSQLGNVYLGIKQLGLAKDSFNLQKRAFETNLANSTSAYNTQIRDRIAGRSYATEEERQRALEAALLPEG